MQALGGIAVAPASTACSRICRDLRVDRVSGGTDEMMILATCQVAHCKAYHS